MKHNLEGRKITDLFMKKELAYSTILYIIIQTILYGLFLTMDLTDSNTDLSGKIKFTMIILCFCYVLFYKKSTDKSILFCLRTALFFTVISDLFLLLLDYYFYGVLSFILVQQLYAVKLDLVKKRIQAVPGKRMLLFSFLPRFGLQTVLAAVFCLILSSQEVILDKLLIITVFYFISIVTNVIRAISAALHYPKESSNGLFAAGMVLFLLCDISVGLFNLSDFIPMSNGLYDLLYALSATLMWTFYAPSQVLISLSVKRR